VGGNVSEEIAAYAKPHPGLKMKGVGSSETSVLIYQITRRHIRYNPKIQVLTQVTMNIHSLMGSNAVKFGTRLLTFRVNTVLVAWVTFRP
jgi:hypothetical protein